MYEYIHRKYIRPRIHAHFRKINYPMGMMYPRWVRILFPYPKKGSKPTLAIIYAAILKGYTEADVRDWRFILNEDRVEVRLWNHRKFLMDGRMLEYFTITCKQMERK
jgi:hypothetical protein